MKSGNALVPPQFVQSKMSQAYSGLNNSEGRDGMPDIVASWLARARLLYGVPFEYIASDASLLPPESLRFFVLDQTWTDRLVDGALSIGKTNTWQRLHHEVVNANVRTALDASQLTLRQQIRTGRGLLRARMYEAPDPSSTIITGFILRSRMVSDYPGMEVTAYSSAANPTVESPEPALPLLRLDRPNPNLMFALFAGPARCVVLRQPAEAIILGVDLDGAQATYSTKQVNAQDQIVAPPPPLPLNGYRPNGQKTGVLDIAAIANAQTPGAPTSAGLAAALLLYPTQFVFNLNPEPGVSLATPNSSPRAGDIA